MSSAGYGYTVGKTIAFAYLPASIETGEELQIDAFGKLYGAEKTKRCLYDPAMKRLKA